MPELVESQLDRLEALVDETSLSDVVRGLITICGMKEDHLRSNWGDAESAKSWRLDAHQLDRVDHLLNW